MQIILMPEAEAMDEAGAIMTTRKMQVPMSALLPSRVIPRNRILISPKAHAVNAVAVTAMVLAVELTEVNRAADS